ncbi:type II toxin-antitoxin system RatA family toxin [Embleya sp. NBC_00896]|uniref:type II toxin-antitoxin system RatA family toxin n=1 Tax=Embleya sp. NBC_00896 TaxID=2975961 RepID=UPI0038675E5F|nr:SRPBCC family protein [Embleya sp. NBC_00896]
MTSRTLKATLPCSAATAIERLGDDRAFPSYAPDVLSVEDAGGDLRRWVLAFRGGTAQWVQRTRGASAERPDRIEFEQVEGDFQQFGGAWTSTDTAGGCEVVFEVGFRTSVPHLAGAIDSAVGRVLIRSAHRVLVGIGGTADITSGGHHLRDLPEHLVPEGIPGHALR